MQCDSSKYQTVSKALFKMYNNESLNQTCNINYNTILGYFRFMINATASIGRWSVATRPTPWRYFMPQCHTAAPHPIQDTPTLYVSELLEEIKHITLLVLNGR